MSGWGGFIILRSQSLACHGAPGGILWFGIGCFEVAHGFHRFAPCEELEDEGNPEKPCLVCEKPQEADILYQDFCHRCGAIDTLAQASRIFMLGMMVAWWAAGRTWIENPTYMLIFQIGAGIYCSAGVLTILGIQKRGVMIRNAVRAERRQK